MYSELPAEVTQSSPVLTRDVSMASQGHEHEHRRDDRDDRDEQPQRESVSFPPSLLSYTRT